MDVSSPLIAAVVAAAVSIIGTLLTVRATTHTGSMQALQDQFKKIVQKRIEFYPKLWWIHINYETNWTLNKKPKTREWAEEYVEQLNNLNLEAGIFFSQAVYLRFFELRAALYRAIEATSPGDQVTDDMTCLIRQIVYGGPKIGGPGLSSYTKDDLGSYQTAMLQRRRLR